MDMVIPEKKDQNLDQGNGNGIIAKDSCELKKSQDGSLDFLNMIIPKKRKHAAPVDDTPPENVGQQSPDHKKDLVLQYTIPKKSKFNASPPSTVKKQKRTKSRWDVKPCDLSLDDKKAKNEGAASRPKPESALPTDQSLSHQGHLKSDELESKGSKEKMKKLPKDINRMKQAKETEIRKPEKNEKSGLDKISTSRKGKATKKNKNRNESEASSNATSMEKKVSYLDRGDTKPVAESSSTFEGPRIKFPQNIHVYEKHRRELERCIERLEKTDKFGFFIEWEDKSLESDPQSGAISISAVDLTGMSRTSSRAMANLLETKIPDGEVKVSIEGSKLKSERLEIYSKKPPRNFTDIRNRFEDDRYVRNRQAIINGHSTILATKLDLSLNELTGVDAPIVAPNLYAIDWDFFRDDVTEMIDTVVYETEGELSPGPPKSGTIEHAAVKLKETLESIYDRVSRKQESEIELIEIQERYRDLFSCNTEPAMQGEWRRNPFKERKYERLQKSYALCSGLSKLDVLTAEHDLITNLPEGFFGMPYSYDQCGSTSEGWMKSVTKSLDEKRKRRKDYNPVMNEVEMNKMLRAQVSHTMEQMLVQVQDRLLTEGETLDQKELCPEGWNSSHLDSVDDGPPAVVEQCVWGIDRYTARNVSLAIGMEYAAVSTEFIESWLLPAINACEPNAAFDITNATQFLQGLPPRNGGKLTVFGKILLHKVKKLGPRWLSDAAQKLNVANSIYDGAFCIHPKGQGVVVIKAEGLKSGSLVTHYLGELYPSWRWGEKMDAIEATQTILGMRPALADFYNMCMERPMHDVRGYGLLFVDASRKAGWASALSHSCDPTCQVQIVSRSGKLSLSMTTVRDVPQGHELTFDYNAVTESLDEYRQAVCLCGHSNCRGSFLHFATADCYQEVMRTRLPMSVRFTLLVRASKLDSLTDQHVRILERHGFGMATFGAASFKDKEESLENVPIWLKMFVAEILKFIEVERKTLPIQLISNEISKKARTPEDKKEKEISYLGADLEGRMHMEQRIQTLTQTLSLVGRVLSIHRLATQNFKLEPPLSALCDQEVIDQIWKNPDSVVRELISKFESDSNVSRQLLEKIKSIIKRFDFLCHSFDNAHDARRGRKYMNRGLLDIRRVILNFSQESSIRDKFEAASDLLLCYAHTKNFFAINQYQAFESTPIEVYARELGNNVPRAKVEQVRKKRTFKSSVHIFEQVSESSSDCYEPEEAVASVSRNYSGDYALTQLLYWFNGGIGTKPGLPGMMGAVLLPSIASWWNKKSSNVVNYSNTIRPKLMEWLKNQHLRKEAWPTDLEQFFTRKNIMVGSPALDSVLSGNEVNIKNIIFEIENKTCEKTAEEEETFDWFGCICGVPHPPPTEAFWIMCDFCECWYNVSCQCVGCNEVDAKSLSQWKCWACKLPCRSKKEDKEPEEKTST